MNLRNIGGLVLKLNGDGEKMIIGKPESHKRALRRHHDKRKKAWVQKTLGHYFMYATNFPARRVGMYSRTPKVCSCFMCGNPRHFHQKPAIQERRAMLELDEFISEAASPLPKTAQSHFG